MYRSETFITRVFGLMLTDATYPLKFRGDPIPSWHKRAAKLRSETNPHAALRHYHSFMLETTKLRDALMESAAAAEAEIDAAIDRLRGK
jgi:hypothetical protein